MPDVFYNFPTWDEILLFPEIVFQAWYYRVVNIGQLNDEEIKQLKQYSKKGFLFETICYDYPIPKKMWIANICAFEGGE